MSCAPDRSQRRPRPGLAAAWPSQRSAPRRQPPRPLAWRRAHEQRHAREQLSGAATCSISFIT